jgi:hypothetical protein
VSDEPLTDEELDRLDALAAQASPAPWRAIVEGRDQCSGSTFILMGGPGDDVPDMYVSYDTHPYKSAVSDLDFIAAARNSLPRLVAEVRRARLSP